jgi:hypothetical protein
MTTAVKKIKTVAAVFELPQKLGILQYVEYEPPPRGWCAGDGCLYEGVLTAEGCRKGVCVRYRVWVHSRDRRSGRRRSGGGGVGMMRWVGALGNRWLTLCGSWLRSTTSGVWYEYRRVGVGVKQYDVFCGVVVNGVELYQPQCRTAEECARQIHGGIQTRAGEDGGAA